MGLRFDYFDGDFYMDLGSGMTMDSDGQLMQILGSGMAMDMDSGNIHIIDNSFDNNSFNNVFNNNTSMYEVPLNEKR